MRTETAPAYYRLELDDYSAAAFTSFEKYYYGTLDELRCFFDALSSNKNHKDPFSQLISAFRAFEAGERDSKHYVAYREVPLLVPVKLLHKEKITLPNHSWEHLNT